MKEKIKQLSLDFFNDIVAIRRDIHQNPELSFKEKETSAYIAQQLDKIDIPYKKNIGGYGIIATLEGKDPQSHIIALRADFDALPIQEETNLPYASKNKGIMHACGHDMHTASLLGVARILKTIADDLKGTVHFIFQPAEELLPGGAQQMLKENLFGDKKPDCIIAQHVDTDIEVGSMGLKQGQYMASGDEIYLTVKGEGGHAALPHKINDTVLASAQILINLPQISARLSSATIPTVLSFGKIQANGATNLIPNEVKIEGTFRTFDEDWRKDAHKHIQRIAQETALSMGCTCIVEIKKGYPVLYNNPKITEKLKKIATNILEKEVLDLDFRMTTEDFAYFSHQYPSVFYRLGVRPKDKKQIPPLHSSKFIAEEEALKTSISLMAYTAYAMNKD